MGKELENEFDPLNISQRHIWVKIIYRLATHPDKVLPVFYTDPDTDEVLGDYFYRIVKERGKVFLQAEGFSNKEVESGFTIGMDDWEPLQPGIYRLELTEEDKA